MLPTEYPVVEVEWLDALSEKLSIDPTLPLRPQLGSLATNHTVGYLIHADDDMTVVVHEMSTSGEVDTTKIRTSWVVGMKTLRKARHGRKTSRQASATHRRPRKEQADLSNHAGVEG